MQPVSPQPHDPELARLLSLWPSEIGDDSFEGRLRIIASLRRAIRAERQRGISGSWTYSLPRHAALLQHLDREMASLKMPSRNRPPA